MLEIRKLKFNLEQPLMNEIQKSGQRIKAKISKVPISHINSMEMVEITPPRRSLPLPLQNSTPSPPPPPPPPIEEEPACVVLNQERRELLNYFGIPENYCSHIKFGDEYTHQICRDRISAFQGRQQLDPRDQRIRIPLNSQYMQKYLEGGARGDMEPLLDEVRDWLIDLIQVTCSVSVGEMKRERFGNEEAKNFAAKNILLNVKEMFESLEGMPLAQRFQIMKFSNTQAQRVLEATIMKYPQTSSRGASRRVQSKVRRIDNREDDQYDFLYRNGITIPYRKSGDYSEDIMRVLNKLIACPTDPFHPESEDTNFEVFTEVMEYIFENSSSQAANTTAADISQLIAMKTRPKGQNYLLSSTNVTELREALSFSDRLDKKSGSGRELAAKDYLIAHKIPAGTPLFTEQELEGGSFKVHDSSVLRILTKWAEELREKLSNAEEAIVKRAHRFKVRSGKLMGLQMNLKEQMYNAALQEEAKVRTYLQFLNKENTALQVVFSQEQNIGRYSKHDTKVGTFAAKMNEIASQYMFKYVNRLIHALRRVPRIAAAEIANQAEKNLLSSVDLVTLKIGDLLRSKYCCSEQEFVRVLGVLEEVGCKNPSIMRIVRIKNRLQKKDNDVLINLYFMDRIECELQLSIRSPHHPKHDHSAFNHFLYEVIRSKLGPLSELANIVTQYDPLIHHFKRMKQYGPPLLQQQWLKDKKKNILDKIVEKLKFKRDMGVLRSLDLPFICCKCFHLTIVTNPQFYYRSPGDLKLTCNYCSFSDILQNCEAQGFAYLMEQSFKDPQARSFYQDHIEHWDFDEELKSIENDGEDVCRMLKIPQQGFYLKKNSKLPKMALYSAVFDSVSNSFIFMAVSSKGTSKPIITLPLYREKKRRIEAFKKELGNFYFFYFQKAKTRIDEGMLYVSCAKEGCCGKEVKAGPIITSTQITEYSHTKAINCSLNSQKSVLNFNGIPQALQRLDKALNHLDDPLKSERMARGIQIIRARACALQGIQVVKNFPNLFELNISNNHDIQSLRGLQECMQLRSLDCKGCDLSNIDELMALRKLQHLNLKGNRRLKDLNGLDGHKQLLDLNIAFTSVISLEPLKQCLKLESLSIEGCANIESLGHINSTALAYLNMVDCTSLEIFDLQLHSAKSLKSVQYVKKGGEKMGFQLIMASLDYLAQDQGEDGQSHITTAVDIDRINRVLKLNKNKMDLSFIMHTIT